MENSEYKLLLKIHESTRIEVYKGLRTADKTPVIIKKSKEEPPEASLIRRFKKEFDILNSVEHDNIIKAHSLISNEKELYLVLEDPDAISLSKILGYRKIEVPEFLDLALLASKTLGYIHEADIVHKDINPNNITWNNKNNDLKIIDFGISTNLSTEKGSNFGNDRYTLEGTLGYISPEQTGRINRRIDYRTDYYSLGVTFYETLSGQPLFADSELSDLVYDHIARKPKPLHEVKPNIPKAISDIVAKLLEKSPDDRYQSSYGLQYDLKKCKDTLKESNQIPEFEIGTKDVSRRFSIPTRLYGREEDKKKLFSAFERVCLNKSEIVFLTGYSGIGKSSLVHEIHDRIVTNKGHFIEGKFDKLKRNIPYLPLKQALTSLFNKILKEDKEKIKFWKEHLLKHLGINGKVITDIIPTLEKIIGKQPEMANLPPSESQNRFNITFKNLLTAIGREDNPIVLFLDDTQWIDPATLSLIEFCFTSQDIKHTLVVCAYRDNEVSDTHPIIRVIDNMKKAFAVLSEINLQPLNLDDITALISDTLKKPKSEVDGLAKVCLKKTNGNPFFLYQFLHALNIKNYITFNSELGSWQWNFQDIIDCELTDNVVDLMIDKIKLLPDDCQKIIKLASCIGNKFDLKTLSLVSTYPISVVTENLKIGISEDIIIPLRGRPNLASMDEDKLDFDNSPLFKFSHDRIQQAAYQQIEEDKRQLTHIKIGHLMLSKLTKRELTKQLFEVINHLNEAIDLIKKESEKIELAELNLEAGMNASKSSAHKAALDYFRNGIKLLPPNAWLKYYSLTIKLYSSAATAANICTLDDEMEKYAEEVIKNAKDKLDILLINEMKIQAYTSHNKQREAVNLALKVLRENGIKFPKKPGKIRVILSLLRLKLFLNKKRVNQFFDLKPCTDPYELCLIRIILRMATAAFFVSPEIQALSVFKRIRLSFKFGLSSPSILALAGYSIILSGILHKYEDGFKFGNLAFKLFEQMKDKEYKGRMYFYYYCFVQHWKYPIRTCVKPLQEGYQIALNYGDIEYLSYISFLLSNSSFFAGINLHEVDKTLSYVIEVLSHYKQTSFLNINAATHQSVLNFLGKSDNPARLKGDAYDEDVVLKEFMEKKNLTAAAISLTIKNLTAYMFGDHEESERISKIMPEFIDGAKATYIKVTFVIYETLNKIKIYELRSNNRDKKRCLKAINKNLKLIRIWAENSPDGMKNKLSLIEAELARIQGETQVAMEKYEESIELASKNFFLQEEALAKELAGRFYHQRHNNTVAKTYLFEACKSYLKWGATAKVDHLNKEFFIYGLKEAVSATGKITLTATATSTFSDTAIDKETLMSAASAISKEVNKEKLLSKLLHIVIKNAGAQKGSLILKKDNKFYIEAEVDIDSKYENLNLSSPVSTSDKLPLTIIDELLNRRKAVIINDSTKEKGVLAKDKYIQKYCPKSIMCAPLHYKEDLVGVFYLENNLVPNAFTKDRLEILKLLAPQIYISLENAKLYNQLEESYRNLVQNSQKNLLELNEAKKRIQTMGLVDPLTKLSNRPKILEVLTSEISSSKPFTLVLADVDNFRDINYRFGEDCGNNLIIQISKILKSNLRERDHIARWDGEAFLFILSETDSDGAEFLTENLRRLIETTDFEYESEKLNVSMTFGLKTFQSNDNVNKILMDADKALSQGKNEGRNKVVVFRSS